ncbi:MAG TPA: DUF6178 family protein [Vicinamibacterales bacterium]|nr:DUF6178 family protein [Vicinamibacterales bacterium]
MPKQLDVTRRPAEPQGLLDRILSTPHLARVVPRLQPEVIHRVIQRLGLEDSSEFVALATPEQLERVFDLDLWRAAGPGRDEQFDADRFGVWLEVLVEAGADVAAGKLAEMDPEIVTAGFAQHVRVFERGAVSRYTTTDGEEIEEKVNRSEGHMCDVGGYLAVARRTDAWEAIVAVLTSLAKDHPDSFDRVMSGCRALSNAGFEIDGLRNLLDGRDQAMFDVAFDREQRREQSGFVAPAQARAFLEASRRLRLNRDAAASMDPIARAHLRATDSSATSDAEATAAAERIDTPPAGEDDAESLAAIVEVLRDAGIFAPQPRALLTAAETDAPRLQHIQAQMQFVLERDATVISQRNDELAFLANTIAAGCSVQARSFSPEEAWNAAVAVCNLGLENQQPLPDDFLLNHNLVEVFQVGWTVLHDNVIMEVAEQLLGVLATLRCDDAEIQSGLRGLRTKLTKHWRAGAPWRAADALDVITTLDMPAWAALAGLLNECPVLHAGVRAMRGSGTHAVSATDFEFISENSQIASIREFLRSLPETLRT